MYILFYNIYILFIFTVIHLFYHFYLPLLYCPTKRSRVLLYKTGSHSFGGVMPLERGVGGPVVGVRCSVDVVGRILAFPAPKQSLLGAARCAGAWRLAGTVDARR